MILQLEIDKIDPGRYEAHCDSHKTTCHESISAVLKHYGEDIPPDFCQFVEVRYGGVSLGTTAVTRMAKEPEVMARELTGLLAAVHRATDEMEHKRATMPKPFV